MLNFPLGTWLKRRFDSNVFAWTPSLPPWASEREHDMRRFRQLARRVLRRRLVKEQGWATVMTQSLAWPVMSGLKAWWAARATVQTGSGPRVQGHHFLDLWWLQLAHNLRVRDQQMLALGSPGRRALAGLSIASYEHQVLMDLINLNTGRKEFEEKRGFARFCAAHHLPTLEILAEGNSGEIVQFLPLPATDLFLKPSDLQGGKGASALPFDAARGCWIGAKGESLTAAEVLPYCRQVQGTHPWILQRRVRNAAPWARWSQGALCTVRIVTGRLTPGAPVEVVGGFMRFPQGNAIVDNRSSGGLSADYDRETGRLGQARDLVRPWIAHSVHPDTKAVIAGEIIPDWERARSLALRAHEPITQIAMIGWDVALPGDDPVLIEMNTNWGIFTNTPFGSTRYLEILHHWIDTPTPEVAEFISARLHS